MRTVLIVVGAVLAVCCVGGIGGGLWLYRSVGAANGPAREAADGFVRDLEAGNHAGAYARLCQRTKEQFSQAAFTTGVRGQPTISSHDIRSVTVRTVNGRRTGLVTVDLTYDTGFVDRHTFPLTEEGGAWKVCGQPY